MQYLIRYGELALKSPRVRQRMESILIQRIKEVFTGNVRVQHSFGRIFLDTDERADLLLRRVFGIVSFSPVVPCTAAMADITATALTLLEHKKFSTFAVSARRTGTHAFSSHDIQVQVGDAIRTRLQKKVDLSHPDVTLWVEVRDESAYVFTDVYPGLGGFPLGTQGKVACMMRTPADELACWLMMRKGCTPVLVGKSSPLLEKWAGKPLVPHTLDDARKDVLAIVSSRLEKRAGLPVYTPLLGMPAAEKKAFRALMRSIR